MRNTLVPVLFLAIVALSASNLLPILSKDEKHEPLDYGEPDDNIFSSKHQDHINDIFFKIDDVNERQLDKHRQLLDDYLNPDINDAEDDNSKDDIYDGKGFRKEQWHNYPRQLDRLNKHFYEIFNSDKRNLEPDDPGEYSDIEESPESPNDITANEIHLDDNDSFDFHSPAEENEKAAAIMNPLIVLKIHLACLKKDFDVSRFQDKESDLAGLQLRQNQNEDYNLDDENPKPKLIKVKREGNTRLEIADSTQHEPKQRTVNKRIFSLWSRLQSLNHKGHELQHRRHLYALYGLPDSEGGGGGGVLTAETRATFMRPPGSPLRWG